MFARFRAALRIARRDAWRSKWRSLLVIALIGLPVFVLAGVDVMYRTYQLDPTEKLTRTIGTADAGIMYAHAPVKQSPAAFLDGIVDPGPSFAGPAVTRNPSAVLPSGGRVIPLITSNAGLRIRTALGIEPSGMKGLDLNDPIATGLVDHVSGRTARTTSEAAITPALARATGLRVGDMLHAVEPDRSFTVVGIVASTSFRSDKTVWVLPSAVSPADAAYADSTLWLADTTSPMTWTDVLDLNALGYAVLSRQQYLHPPPASQIQVGQSTSGTSSTVIATGTLIAGMALLEVVLLAGPAFAVSARRQRRELALIAAIGGRRGDLRNVVLANAIVLGVAAGVVAAAAGVTVTAIGIPTLGTHLDTIPGNLDLRPLELGALALVSLVTALLAAVLPALVAGRTDVLAALAGRRGEVRARKRWPILGAVVTALGVTVALGGVTVRTSATVILAGVALTEVGLIICTPALLGGLARLGPRLPLGPRIALRDAARNRSAAAPAVAAVMAAMIGAVSVAIGVSSAADQDRRNYRPSMPSNAAYVDLTSAAPSQSTTGPADVTAALRNTLPTGEVVPVRTFADRCAHPTGSGVCTSTFVSLTTTPGVVSRYQGGWFPNVIYDDGTAVQALLGTSAPQAVAALRAGRVVVPDASMAHNGTIAVSLESDAVGTDPSTLPPATPPARTMTFPATVVSAGFPAAQAIIPPHVAAALGLTASTVGVLAKLDRAPTDREMQAVNGALDKLAGGLRVQRELGFRNPSEWMLYALMIAAGVIALGAAAIATTLANVDGRSDLVTLGAVGASPRTRRVMSMSRAGVIASIGCVVGVAAGFVPAVAWIRTGRSPVLSTLGVRYYDASSATPLRLVVPWWPILLALAGIPLAAMLFAGLFTRSRLPSERPGL